MVCHCKKVYEILRDEFGFLVSLVVMFEFAGYARGVNRWKRWIKKLFVSVSEKMLREGSNALFDEEILALCLKAADGVKTY
jgi:hypothetical protein